MSDFRFDPSTHEYFLGDDRIPGVTNVLVDLGIVDYSHVPPDILERARLRGQAVHYAVMLANEGTLDPRSVDERLEPYLYAYEGFRQATGFRPDFFEQPLVDPVLRVAGTPDGAGPVYGDPTVVDFKAIEHMSQPHGMQLAIYKHLLVLNGFSVDKRIVVQLKPDGTFKLHPQTDPLDLQEFRAALFVWQRRAARHGRVFLPEVAI